MPNVERLLIASAPLQEFIMTTRRVYRYESPAETLKYLLIYCTLWYFNLILPGLISALLYFVIERHVHGTTVDDLRKDIVQRENSQETALTLAELIIKKGEQQWADDLLKRAGPWMMVQLVDHANFFETVRKLVDSLHAAEGTPILIPGQFLRMARAASYIIHAHTARPSSAHHCLRTYTPSSQVWDPCHRVCFLRPLPYRHELPRV